MRQNYETNCILERKNGEYTPCLKYSVQHYLIGFYKSGGKCLQRGTD